MKFQAQLCSIGNFGETVRTAVPLEHGEPIEDVVRRTLCMSGTRTERNESITSTFPISGHWLEIRAYRDDGLTV